MTALFGSNGGPAWTVEELAENWPLEELAFFEWQLRWKLTRRPNQMPPPGDWGVWNILAGRGFGKTRVGAETLAEWAMLNPGTRWLVSAPTAADLRSTCFEGESGLIAVIPRELLVPTVNGNPYNSSTFELEVKCPYAPGQTSLIKGISAENPERFRGPQFHGGWLDELAAWKYLQMAWDMIAFTMRLGASPRLIVTTTPRPKPLIKQLADNKLSIKVVSTRGSSKENFANLAPTFRDQLMQYENTQLGKQEIYGEILDSEEGGIIKRSWLGLWPAGTPLPAFDEVIVSLDTAFTERTFDKKNAEADPTACLVFGVWHSKPIGSTTEKLNIMILDAWDEHYGMPQLLQRMRDEVNPEKTRYGGEEQKPMFRPQFGPATVAGAGRPVDTVVIEEKGSGISLRQMLAAEDVFTYPYNPGRADKLSRLHGISHIASAGVVFIMESERNPGQPKDWYQKFLAQLCSYAGPETTDHDDYVDAFSQGLRYIADRYRLRVSPVKKDPDEDKADLAPKPVVNPYSN